MASPLKRFLDANNDMPTTPGGRPRRQSAQRSPFKLDDVILVESDDKREKGTASEMFLKSNLVRTKAVGKSIVSEQAEVKDDIQDFDDDFPRHITKTYSKPIFKSSNHPLSSILKSNQQTHSKKPTPLFNHINQDHTNHHKSNQVSPGTNSNGTAPLSTRRRNKVNAPAEENEFFRNLNNSIIDDTPTRTHTKTPTKTPTNNPPPTIIDLDSDNSTQTTPTSAKTTPASTKTTPTNITTPSKSTPSKPVPPKTPTSPDSPELIASIPPSTSPRTRRQTRRLDMEPPSIASYSSPFKNQEFIPLDITNTFEHHTTTTTTTTSTYSKQHDDSESEEKEERRTQLTSSVDLTHDADVDIDLKIDPESGELITQTASEYEQEQQEKTRTRVIYSDEEDNNTHTTTTSTNHTDSPKPKRKFQNLQNDDGHSSPKPYTEPFIANNPETEYRGMFLQNSFVVLRQMSPLRSPMLSPESPSSSPSHPPPMLHFSPSPMLDTPTSPAKTKPKTIKVDISKSQNSPKRKRKLDSDEDDFDPNEEKPAKRTEKEGKRKDEPKPKLAGANKKRGRQAKEKEKEYITLDDTDTEILPTDDKEKESEIEQEPKREIEITCASAHFEDISKHRAFRLVFKAHALTIYDGEGISVDISVSDIFSCKYNSEDDELKFELTEGAQMYKLFQIDTKNSSADPGKTISAKFAGVSKDFDSDPICALSDPWKTIFSQDTTTTHKPVTRKDTKEKEVVKSYTAKQLNEVLATFPPNPRPNQGVVTVTRYDYNFLDPGEFLNDTVLEFYLKFIQERVTTEEHRDRFYFFNTFFYERLGGKQKKDNLEKWTSKVDIFAYDFLIIPINESAHWSLMVVCHANAVSEESSQKKAEEKKNKKDNEEVSGKRPKAGEPCIIYLDSLNTRPKGFYKIRDYLTKEWNTRKKETGQKRKFDGNNLPGYVLPVPMQENYYDCGLFLLHYVEKFALTPDVTTIKKEWFTNSEIEDKRTHIKATIDRLRAEQHPDADEEEPKTPELPSTASSDLIMSTHPFSSMSLNNDMEMEDAEKGKEEEKEEQEKEDEKPKEAEEEEDRQDKKAAKKKITTRIDSVDDLDDIFFNTNDDT